MATQPVRRQIARKVYENGNWGSQSASLTYEAGENAPWVVSAWDHWAHNTLAEAKAHFRGIGAQA